MAAMFKKPKRNFRKKLESADSDEERNDNNTTRGRESHREAGVMTVSDLKKSRDKKKRDKDAADSNAQVLLSFGDTEEDDAEFHVKKSSHSRKVVKDLKKKSQQEKEESKQKREKPNTQVSRSGEYSRDKLEELKSQQKTTNGRRKSRSPSPFEEMPKFEPPKKHTHDPFSSILQTGLIPDASTIHEIRKKRQLARERGDFIPLDDTVKVEKNKSRLIREDENDLSDDDERINFTINTHAIERQKLRDGFLAAEQGSDGEGDSEHEREWEEQQIRKGVNSQQVNAIVDGLKDQFLQNTGPPQQLFTPYPQASFAAPTPFTANTNLANLTIDVIKKNLKDRLESMESIYKSHRTDLDKLSSDSTTTESDISSGKSSTDSLEKRYKFFQETRGYIRDVMACLNEKVPRINKLELRIANQSKTRAAKLVTRRQQDTKDQCLDYSSTGKFIPNTSEPMRQQRAADREARRARRRREREKKMIVGHNEGLSSDDEETPSELSKYRTDSDIINLEISGVFDDAVEDFYEIAEIRRKFEEWKFRYNDSYTEAYIGLCLPKLLNPLIRLQLVTWNPLEEGHRDMEDCPWFRDLAIIGHHAGIAMDIKDNDARTIPSVVEKIVLQKITDVAANIWDPLSTTQTCRLVNLVQKLVSDYPTVNVDSKYVQSLLKAIVMRIRKTLDDDIFMPLYPKSVIENKGEEASTFFNRQFWTCVKLLGNILSWYGILEDTILQQLSLDSLLNRYIVLGVQSSGINDALIKRCHTIVSTLPKPWFNDLKTDKTMPQLENLCRYLDYAAGIMGNVSHDVTDMQRKLSRERVKQIIKLLNNMSAHDHAKQLCEQFSIKL